MLRPELRLRRRGFVEVTRLQRQALTRHALMRFHDLRKPAASILSAIGFSIPEIMAILGHKTMRMTAEVYAQAHPRNRRAAEALDRLFAVVRP